MWVDVGENITNRPIAGGKVGEISPGTPVGICELPVVRGVYYVMNGA